MLGDGRKKKKKSPSPNMASTRTIGKNNVSPNAVEATLFKRHPWAVPFDSLPLKRRKAEVGPEKERGGKEQCLEVSLNRVNKTLAFAVQGSNTHTHTCIHTCIHTCVHTCIHT